MRTTSNTDDITARTMFGAVRGYGREGGFALMVRGVKVAEVDGDELDKLAQGLAFRLATRDIAAGPSGLVARVGDTAFVHLCYSDEYDELLRRLRSAASGAGVNA